MNFILERAKAFVAAIAVGLVPVIIKAFETSSSFDIPPTWEAAIMVFVTGLLVHQVPNKAA
jgi:Mn2+/Fe2+ NRAMP family transporter